MDSRIRYEHMHDELPARVKGQIGPYESIPRYVNILPKFDRFHFEAPNLMVEMKSGGEVLHSFGMYETGTSKIGMYAGKPTAEHTRQIMTLGLDVYSSTPAGNVNLAGYCAYIQAWRGINAFFYMGGGDMSRDDMMKAGISREAHGAIAKIFEEQPEDKGKRSVREKRMVHLISI